MKKLPRVTILFLDQIENNANILMRYAIGQPPGFARGVRALAEMCGVHESDLTTVTSADLEAMLDEVQL